MGKAKTSTQDFPFNRNIYKTNTPGALFMLVSVLMGIDRMQAAYAHAIAESYRFYSYGDASLLLP